MGVAVMGPRNKTSSMSCVLSTDSAATFMDVLFLQAHLGKKASFMAIMASDVLCRTLTTWYVFLPQPIHVL